MNELLLIAMWTLQIPILFVVVAERKPSTLVSYLGSILSWAWIIIADRGSVTTFMLNHVTVVNQQAVILAYSALALPLLVVCCILFKSMLPPKPT